MSGRSCSKHIVLLGIGHTNAHIVRMWGMNPIADTDLTCITDFPVATYSGMLPAVLAQQVPTEQMQIDLVRLCGSVGARLICGKVTGIDHDKREIQMDDRPPIPFDALSIGIGSVPTTDGVSITGESLIKIKPMQTFLQRLADAVERAENHSNSETLNVVVVGSGVAGVEICLCLPNFLAKHSNRSVQLSIITRSEQILPDADSMRAKTLAELTGRGVQITTGQSVVAVNERHVSLSGGTQVDADIVIWATGASAPDALERFDLPVDERGFLKTDRTLQSVSGMPCFAVGDTGTVVGERIPKAGVYAVRQGPVLWENLHRLLKNQELTQYHPQRSFLKLLNYGNGHAIGQWKGFSFSGRWVMSLKQRIDTKFMRMYQPGNSMSGQVVSDATDKDEMQCRGCGCKLGSQPLAEAMKMIRVADDSDAQGIPLEDAAVISQNDGTQLLASTDFFTTPFDDAYLSGRIAALHSASDIIASGGMPTHALANVVLSEGNEETQKRSLADFLSGAGREFRAMGANIVGGHTIVGPRMEAGFTVIGHTAGDMLRKNKLRCGDVLCLTKPLGIGIILAGHMRGECRAEEYFGVIEAMLMPQHGYVPIAKSHPLAAMTDVTGFGLAGHLIEMLRESKVSAEMSLESIPLIDGTERLLQAGIQSTLAPDNRRFQRWIAVDESIKEQAKYKALFDPQTCGGLLFGINPEHLEGLTVDLTNVGLPAPIQIATVSETGNAVLTIKR
ncbi:MAG: selenide, water dikinase SelD [Pirellulaceae bacterium]